MLETCFTHLPGVGPAMCEKLNKAGIFCWEDALIRPLPCGSAKAESLRAGIKESRERLSRGDACWFGNALSPSEQWRLFPHFQASAAYVDIETSGLSWPECHITTIALFDGKSVRTYVHGINLEAFADDILPFKLLVTWNGRGFDAPFLRRTLHIPLDKGDMAHLDLLPVYRSLGLRGGLKKVECKLGLDREELSGVDGLAAVWLWQRFEATGDKRYLETLLAYNAADVLSLEFLAEYALKQHGASGFQSTREAKLSLNPHNPNPDILRELRAIFAY